MELKQPLVRLIMNQKGPRRTKEEDLQVAVASFGWEEGRKPRHGRIQTKVDPIINPSLVIGGCPWV